MKIAIRGAAFASAAAGVLGLLPLLPGTAAAAQPWYAPAFPFACRSGAVSVSDAAGATVPTARRSGVALTAVLRVHNTEAVPLPKAGYVFAIGDLMADRGPAPTVRWRIGTGTWHTAALHWNATTNSSLPMWNTSTLSLGTIPGHSTVTTEVSVTFAAKSVKAVYEDFLDINSGVCSGASLDGYLGNGFEYWPWTGVEGEPA